MGPRAREPTGPGGPPGAPRNRSPRAPGVPRTPGTGGAGHIASARERNRPRTGPRPGEPTRRSPRIRASDDRKCQPRPRWHPGMFSGSSGHRSGHRDRIGVRVWKACRRSSPERRSRCSGQGCWDGRGSGSDSGHRSPTGWTRDGPPSPPPSAAWPVSFSECGASAGSETGTGQRRAGPGGRNARTRVTVRVAVAGFRRLTRGRVVPSHSAAAAAPRCTLAAARQRHSGRPRAVPR